MPGGEGGEGLWQKEGRWCRGEPSYRPSSPYISSRRQVVAGDALESFSSTGGSGRGGGSSRAIAARIWRSSPSSDRSFLAALRLSAAITSGETSRIWTAGMAGCYHMHFAGTSSGPSASAFERHGDAPAWPDAVQPHQISSDQLKTRSSIVKSRLALLNRL